MPDEYEMLSLAVSTMMSEASKKYLSVLTDGCDENEAGIIETAFKAGWMMGVNDCGFKTLGEYAEDMHKKKMTQK